MIIVIALALGLLVAIALILADISVTLDEMRTSAAARNTELLRNADFGANVCRQRATGRLLGAAPQTQSEQLSDLRE